MDLLKFIENLDNNLVTIVSIIGSLSVLAAIQYKWFKKELDSIFIQLAKNFLIWTMAKLEEGQKLSEIEMEGFKETYGLYREKNGNTYVKERYEKDKAAGLF